MLAERTPHQVHLLETILEGRAKLGSPNYTLGVEPSDGRRLWPNFQYVERTLYRKHNLDAREVVSTCPTIRGSGGDYGWIWANYPLRDGSIIGITIAGMSHVDGAVELVNVFLHVLTLMVATERAFAPSPAEVLDVTLSTEVARAALKQRDRRLDIGPRAFDDLREILRREPATWHSLASEDDWTLSPFLRRYSGITTAQEYVERVIDVHPPPQPNPEPLHPSSLSLPEAIDYLNLVWRFHARAPLVRIGRAEATAKLALDCATVDEFESRVSALCSILAAIEVPCSEGNRLIDLRSYMQEKLGPEKSTRAVEAIDDLKAVFDVRVGRQHAGTDERAARGMSHLGLPVPIYDWGAAWQQLQARTVTALSALREESEALGT